MRHLLALVFVALAGGQGAAPTAAQSRFIESLVAAMRAPDSSAMRKLTHPAVLACINADNRELFDTFLAPRPDLDLSGTYRVTAIEPLGPNPAALGVPPGFGSNPVPPTHQIQIDFQGNAQRSVSLVRQIAQLGGNWYMVFACPTPAGVAAFREARQEQLQAKARAQKLAAAVTDPLRAELNEMMRAGRRIEAWKKYSAVSGEDLAMAREVVGLVTGAGRP